MLGSWTNTFSLWCLNPAVVFKSIAESAQSVILTSGTLSPLNTFSSELGVQFNTCLEAPHIIDVDSQVWAAAIANGPGNYPLNASYKTADEYAFQDAVSSSLEKICMVVPGGCLVFFPSYKLLDKLSTRWQETGQWSRLNAQKPIFVGGHIIRCLQVPEGMDFSDDNARVVVIVRIPFPNVYDSKVAQKNKFNDTYQSSKNLLSGNEWYCQQAFRALNQAAAAAEICNDLMAYSLILSCCCYTCCIRRKLRKRLNIEGGLFDDFLSHLMCCCCAFVQEWREVEICEAK